MCLIMGLLVVFVVNLGMSVVWGFGVNVRS